MSLKLALFRKSLRELIKSIIGPALLLSKAEFSAAAKKCWYLQTHSERLLRSLIPLTVIQSCQGEFRSNHSLNFHQNFQRLLSKYSPLLIMQVDKQSEIPVQPDSMSNQNNYWIPQTDSTNTSHASMNQVLQPGLLHKR